MVYTPSKAVTITDWQLRDHLDLSTPLSFFLNKEAYLVVIQNKHYYALDLSKILTFQRGLNLSSSVGSGLSSLLTDQFVATYGVTHLPDINPFVGPNGLRVFDPSATKKHHVHFSSIDNPEVIDNRREKGFLDDLLITSTENMSNYLVAVNGVFHPTVYRDKKLWVLDGFRTIRLSGKRDVLVVDTSLIGGHQIIPLTTSNVEETDWAQKALIKVSSPIVNKCVFAVIDGYFHHRDTRVLEWQSSTRAYLHTNKLSLIEQFRHNPRTFLPNGRWQRDEVPRSRRYTDPFQSIFTQSWSVPTTTLQSRAFQYSRLTSFHSFLVVLNNPKVYTVSEELDNNPSPQFFTHQGETYLSGMMRYGCGLSPSHAIWSDPEGRHSIFIPGQIGDSDYHQKSGNPVLIPTPDQVPDRQSATMVNYISA